MTKIALGIVFAALLALMGASSSHAASSWDNTVDTTDHLIISDLDGNYGPIDVTTSYTAIMANECPSAYADYADTIADENGKWIIIQGLGSASYPNSRSVLVGWTTNNVSFEFTILNSHEVFRADGNIDYVSIQLDNSGNEECNGPYNSRPGITDPQYVWNEQPNQLILVSTFPVIYPPGYEGIEIPDTFVPPNYSDAAPNWVCSVLNYKAQCSDTNFFTFDNIPFTCGDGLVPVLHYEIYDDDGEEPVLLISGTQSASGQLTYDFPAVDDERDYSIIGFYECGDDDPTFTETGVYDFTINEYGQLDQSAFDECLKDEFPFIDIPACIGNTVVLIDLLTFGAVQIPDLPDPNGCHTLGTIGDWLLVPNDSRQICPQFSSTIRNIVTPFVTFIAGIVIMGAIANKSRKEMI